ncbi:RagB/SusD family nutrient uptake outer membrane protein [Flavobacterium soyae]|uniref:RagB/SusD family nutrient uptake outer membrane protein n=1 Tax=Flavobacterium soyae TaxID=2903098 RepID=UPI001E55D244|nr:RagB/SusD family nutrient uptake outer membrane protein [Flavobacterium soyae]MCD9574999.1 RagB/SusD family nutrient uptake outer membrane protein [Flavobacterium soyae]
MKKLIYMTLIGGLTLGLFSCQDDFLDLKPQDTFNDASYFKRASDFKSYSTDFYNQLMGWRSPYGGNEIYNHMDFSSDLSVYFNFQSDVGRGTIAPGSSDNRWNNPYAWIRKANTLLSKEADYPGNKNDIAQYISEAYFFRANAYYSLLKTFGGVPIVTDVLNINSPELQAPRNSRYEVVTQILSDLDKAIANLPIESAIVAADKGRVSKWAAKGLKAEVELYEATWRKYNGTTTDFEGSGGPASNQINDFLTDAANLSKEIIDNGGYSLWNYNSTAGMINESYYYLFSLEDAGSNPAGLTKASNNEFILYGVYDVTLRTGNQNLSLTSQNAGSSRKMMDMFLCTDGLPPSKSPLFQGYHAVGDEYKNRDLRLLGYGGAAPASTSLTTGIAGYGNRKFVAYKYGTYRNANQESANYPIIRLAEIYLIYAEALFERDGAITDADLNMSINKIRARAGVASLTNALVSSNGLNMKDEIRRERTLELYREGFRYDDLKRWGIAEAELNQSVCGQVVGDASYSTPYKDALGNPTAAYKPSTFTWGEEVVNTAQGPLRCVVVDGKSNRVFSKKNYLWPIPLDQRNLNPSLKQNPGY